MKKVEPKDFIDAVAAENRKAWKKGKRRHRLFLDELSWAALEVNCHLLSGPDIGVIVPEEGMTFMGIKMFKSRPKNSLI